MSIVTRLLNGLFFLLSLALLAAGLIALSEGWHRYAYLLDIFTVPLTTAALLSLMMFALLRQRASAIIVLVALLCFGLSLAPDTGGEAPKAQGASFRIVFANLLIDNRTPQDLIPWIDRQSPDIIALVEANHRAHDQLIPALSRTYPHVARRYDMYILSRYPLNRVDARGSGFALLSARVITPDGPVTLAVAHLTRPWPFTPPKAQMQQFRRLVTSLSGEGTPLILVGDFNSAAPTGPMRHLRQELNLISPPAYSGTWPALFPGVIRIGIDHIMVSRDLAITGRKTGPAYGSDHSPVRADIHWQSQSQSD